MMSRQPSAWVPLWLAIQHIWRHLAVSIADSQFFKKNCWHRTWLGLFSATWSPRAIRLGCPERDGRCSLKPITKGATGMALRVCESVWVMYGGCRRDKDLLARRTKHYGYVEPNVRRFSSFRCKFVNNFALRTGILIPVSMSWSGVEVCNGCHIALSTNRARPPSPF